MTDQDSGASGAVEPTITVSSTDGAITEPQEQKPVETPDQPDPNVNDEPETPKDEPDEPKKKGGFTKKLERKDQEIAELRAELARRAVAPEAGTEQGPEPKLEDFDYDQEKFIKATLKYNREQEKAHESAQRRNHDFQARADALKEAGYDKYEDFEAVALKNPDLVITNDMAAIIADSDHGADLAYHLGKNPVLALRISKMGPLAQAREFGRLEAKLESSDEPAVPRQTKAAPPIAPVKAQASTGKKDPREMSQAEYEKWRGYR